MDQPTYNFFEILQINPIQVNVSFSRSVDSTVKTGGGGVAALYRYELRGAPARPHPGVTSWVRRSGGATCVRAAELIGPV